MANPAPTINQINAFNATQGTIIDFNIIGGTELVRSNRIYIYDLSDNSLICTHLYVSTESIHELPANTDSSIVYESGKSSADFVNGAQYYAQIQTYTDTAGTEGGSGLSVAKMFWCLVNPTLTITTIPSTISTTSYNVSATYNANTSVVSNITQQYQFRLYSATGSLLQSSGVVVGNGTQQGTSTAYDISYNFTGLSVGSSYYVVVDVTTTQGMSISTQSNTFTVSIDTPTLGEATVVNNACDGYISVTSNLSGEYGGSASGEIASFVTSSVNDVSSLKVTLEPIQDLHGYDKPWSAGAGVNKFDSVSWGALGRNPNYYTVASNGYITINSGDGGSIGDRLFDLTAGENYKIVQNGFSDVRVFDSSSASLNESNFTVPSDGKIALKVIATSYPTTGWVMIVPYSSTVTTWQPYSNICPISGRTEVVTSVTGKNLFDRTIHINSGYRDDNGVVQSASGSSYTDAIKVNPSTTYTASGNYATSNYTARVYFLTAKGEWISKTNSIYVSQFPYTFTTPSNCGYIQIQIATASTLTNCQIEAGSTATDYEPFGVTYTTDLGRTVYGGTLDVVSGLLTVDRASVELEDLDWSDSTSTRYVSKTVPGMVAVPSSTTLPNMIAEQYSVVKWSDGLANNHDSIAVLNNNQARLYLYKDADTQPPTGKIVYELATPTTIQCDPQTVQTLMGDNNVWGDGSVSITYNIPITNLLVKRQDVADVSGTWLTLHSQPITQASDMDFTFIDFLNQYGKTYKYALVPLLTQTQSGVEVEVEGGYTVSDEVQSIFDGVFIADQTGLQKCKANVGYGDVDMNQSVGTITPIGAKYPVVITNSKNQYHNGSISGTIVPDDYYFNGNLSRIDMVNKRNELEQFLTNKRAKIIKDWNSNIWLVMITENINCTFNNEYGMGLVNFNASWIEVGDPTNQQDLQAAGLIDVGGV